MRETAIVTAHDDQDLDSVLQRLLAERCPPAALRNSGAAHGRVDRVLWRELADGGWAGIAAPESTGGAGQSLATLQLVLFRLGEAGAPVPFRSTVAEVLTFLRFCLPVSPVVDELMASIVRGQIWVPATNDIARPTPAEPTSKTTSVSTLKEFVPDAQDADGFLVTTTDKTGKIRWTAVPNGPDVSMVHQPNPSDEGRYRVRFDGAHGDTLAVTAAPSLDQLRTLRWLAEASWTVGLLRRVLAMTVDHVAVRHQFGRAIGSFQAVQHKLADLTIHTQLCSHLSRSAAILCDEEGIESTTAIAEVAAAIDATRRTADLMTRHAHQLWGGAGVSVEYDLYLFTSRLKSVAYCTDDHAVARHQALAFWLPPARSGV